MEQVKEFECDFKNILAIVREYIFAHTYLQKPCRDRKREKKSYIRKKVHIIHGDRFLKVIGESMCTSFVKKTMPTYHSMTIDTLNKVEEIMTKYDHSIKAHNLFEVRAPLSGLTMYIKYSKLDFYLHFDFIIVFFVQ